MEVANISHNAGTSKIKGLKILEPLVSTLLSTEPSCVQINIIIINIVIYSLENKNHKYLHFADHNSSKRS